MFRNVSLAPINEQFNCLLLKLYIISFCTSMNEFELYISISGVL